MQETTSKHIGITEYTENTASIIQKGAPIFNVKPPRTISLVNLYINVARIGCNFWNKVIHHDLRFKKPL